MMQAPVALLPSSWMASPRDEPYVWVTWITRLLAGESHCEWAAWFRAHHTYDKAPSDFDLAAWSAEHAAMVRARAAALRGEGAQVTLEGQNSFRLRGATGTTLSGKPDIVAVTSGSGGDGAVVIDCKTGSPKASDQFQVMTYMLVLPHCNESLRGRTLQGEVQYRTGSVAVPASKVTPRLRELFRQVMDQAGGATPPPRVPSWDECRFCDITAADCPQRVTSAPVVQPAANPLF